MSHKASCAPCIAWSPRVPPRRCREPPWRPACLDQLGVPSPTPKLLARTEAPRVDLYTVLDDLPPRVSRESMASLVPCHPLEPRRVPTSDSLGSLRTKTLLNLVDNLSYGEMPEPARLFPTSLVFEGLENTLALSPLATGKKLGRKRAPFGEESAFDFAEENGAKRQEIWKKELKTIRVLGEINLSQPLIKMASVRGSEVSSKRRRLRAL